jgi:hypothetical protein
MSEETQEGGLSGLKKTILGVAGTAVTGFGIWATTNINKIFGVEEESEVKTEQVAEQAQPAAQAAPIVLNIDNSATNNASAGGGGTNTIIKETVREVPAAQPAAAAPVEEKKETTAERIARLKKEKADKDGAQN